MPDAPSRVVAPLRRAPTIISVPNGEGCRLVAIHDGAGDLDATAELNAVARQLWETLPETFSEADVQRLLKAQWQVPPDRVMEDARRFFDGLVARGLLMGENEPAPSAMAQTPSPADPDVARAVLSSGHRLRLHARGRSMRPQLPDGSVLEVEPRNATSIQLGDIGFYVAGGSLVAHRIVGRRGADLLARGDSAARVDVVAPDELLGVVSSRLLSRQGKTHRTPLSSGWRRGVGLITGPLWLAGAAAARVLVVRPLKSIPPFRHGLSILIRTASGVLHVTDAVMRRVRRHLNVMRAALQSSREKDEDRRLLYSQRPVRDFTALDENVEAGLTLIEEVLLTRHPLPEGRTLVLGCGPGREAVALARRGLQVVGLDRDQGMLDRARALAAREEVEIDWVTADASDFCIPGPKFRNIVIFSGLYNMVLPSQRRVALLRQAREHLQAEGRVLLTFLSDYLQPGSGTPAQSRTLLQSINPDHEAGDLHLLNEAVHIFPHPDCLRTEVREAGLMVIDLFRDQRAYDQALRQVRGYAVLGLPSE